MCFSFFNIYSIKLYLNFILYKILFKGSMKESVLLLLIMTLISAFFMFSGEKVDEKSLFEEWKSQYNIKYSSDQENYRFGVFMENYQKIQEHNAKLGKSHTEAINQFAALTHEEFIAQYLSSYQQKSNKVSEEIQEETPNGPNVDWVTYGAVSPVKNQGSCGATYAFSAVGALEGLSAIVYKSQTQISVQQIIDCTTSYGNNGCSTGRMDYSFQYVRDKGINSWASYPYNGRQGACGVTGGSFRIKSYNTVKDCNNLATALISEPVSVAVDGRNFQFYKSGIFSNCSTNLTLAVLLVGMTDNYWTLKNSWGTTWGEAGYIRISRGNTCGVCNDCSYPV